MRVLRFTAVYLRLPDDAPGKNAIMGEGLMLRKFADTDAFSRAFFRIFNHDQQCVKLDLGDDLNIRIIQFHDDFILEKFDHIADSRDSGETVSFGIIRVAHFGHNPGYSETVGEQGKGKIVDILIESADSNISSFDAGFFQSENVGSLTVERDNAGFSIKFFTAGLIVIDNYNIIFSVGQHLSDVGATNTAPGNYNIHGDFLKA